MSSTTAPEQRTSPARQRGQVAPTTDARPPQLGVALVGLVVAAALAWAVWERAGQVPVVLFAIGTALGFVLFHSRFGFTSAWRQLVSVRQCGLRAHMLMIGVAATLFAPILAGGVAWKGADAVGSLAPIGFGVTVGAFLFGVGMQIGGSCASGTLFAVGSGQTAILLTLGGFVAGSTLGAYHFPWWTNDLPSHAPVSLASTSWGYPGAWLMTMAAIAVIVAATYRRTPASRGHRAACRPRSGGPRPRAHRARLVAAVGRRTAARRPQRPDPVGLGQRLGHHHGVRHVGLKLLGGAGVDVTSWGYWQDPANAAKFDAGWLAEKTSVMDLGIILGALVASALAGAFVVHRRIPAKLALGAVVGGVMMGYGARIAFGGCNIGAYFDGIASFSPPRLALGRDGA